MMAFFHFIGYCGNLLVVRSVVFMSRKFPMRPGGGNGNCSARNTETGGYRYGGTDVQLHTGQSG
jgi:hypothetical protein